MSHQEPAIHDTSAQDAAVQAGESQPYESIEGKDEEWEEESVLAVAAAAQRRCSAPARA
jgi:hypothetical protein